MAAQAVFTVKKLKNPSLVDKLLHKSPKINAILELNNLLASKPIQEISNEDVQGISYQYKSNLKKDFYDQIANLYKKFLVFCLEDKKLSENEIDQLRHLKGLLNLTDLEVSSIHEKTAGEVYRMEVHRAIEDRRLNEEEKTFLRRLQTNLKLSDEFAQKIYKESAKTLIKGYVQDALADERLTEEEEKELLAIKKSLNIEVHMAGSDRVMLEKCKLFWQIENGKLPEFEVDLDLGEETCHFHTNAEWIIQELKKKVETGPQLRVKLSKGLYFPTAVNEKNPTVEDIWAKTDQGSFYLTNRQIIMNGKDGNFHLPLVEILDFIPFKNGVRFYTVKQKDIFIQFEEYTDIFAVILGKLILDLTPPFDY